MRRRQMFIRQNNIIDDIGVQDIGQKAGEEDKSPQWRSPRIQVQHDTELIFLTFHCSSPASRQQIDI